MARSDPLLRREVWAVSARRDAVDMVTRGEDTDTNATISGSLMRCTARTRSQAVVRDPARLPSGGRPTDRARARRECLWRVGALNVAWR